MSILSGHNSAKCVARNMADIGIKREFLLNAAIQIGTRMYESGVDRWFKFYYIDPHVSTWVPNNTNVNYSLKSITIFVENASAIALSTTMFSGSTYGMGGTADQLKKNDYINAVYKSILMFAEDPSYSLEELKMMFV